MFNELIFDPDEAIEDKEFEAAIRRVDERHPIISKVRVRHLYMILVVITGLSWTILVLSK